MRRAMDLEKNPLVQPHGDPPHPRPPQAGHQPGQPRLRPPGRVRAPRPPAHPEAVARLQDVGQKGVVRGAAPLLRVVAPLRPGLLQPVAHHDGRVHDDRRRPGRPAGQLPAPPRHPPQQLVQKRRQHGRRTPQPAPERGRVRHPRPAEDAAHAPPLQKRQVVHHPAAVQEQHHPRLDHERWPVAAGDVPAPPVDPAAQPQRVPQLPNHDEAARVGDPPAAPADPQRGRRSLHVRARSGIVVSTHHSGVLRSGVNSCSVPLNVGPRAVLFHSPKL